MRYEERFEQVLQAGAKVFAERGYHQASIREIAREAGISLAGLYYYFKSKEELLFLITDHTFASILENLDRVLMGVQDPVERLRHLVYHHLDFFLRHMSELKVASHEDDSLNGPFFDAVAEKKRRYYHRCQEILRELDPHWADEDLRVATLALFGMLNWVYTWYRPGRDGDARRLATLMSEVFLRGFSRNNAYRHLTVGTEA